MFGRTIRLTTAENRGFGFRCPENASAEIRTFALCLYRRILNILEEQKGQSQLPALGPGPGGMVAVFPT